MSGTVVEVNEGLEESPETVNHSAEDEGWFIKIEITDESQLGSLLDADAYKEHCENEAH